MSETRTCSECGLRTWSTGRVTERTVERLDAEGEVVDAVDRLLCRSCYEDLLDPRVDLDE